MGREQRRKEEKKNKKSNINHREELDTSIKGITIIKIISTVVIILLVLYYFVAVFITKELDVSGNKNNNQTEATNVSNRILASQIFEQKEEEYFVYFYDFDDEDRNIATALNEKSDMKIYRVNTKDGLNQNYVTEDVGNANVTSIENLKVKNPTFIKISGDSIVSYYEGSSAITNYLNQ